MAHDIVVAGRKRRVAGDSPLAPWPCVHRGADSGELVECGTCPTVEGQPRTKTRLKAFACALPYGRCTLDTPAADQRIPCCRLCPERQSPARELLPGVLDPLPDPPLNPQPAGWACRDDVAPRHVVAFQELLRRTFEPPADLAGDAILIYGEGQFWPGIVITCRLLRELGCTLPVQVWYRGSAGKVDAADVAGLGVELLDAETIAPAPRALGGWQIKSVAIMEAVRRNRYARLLCLDADCHPVTDPTPLFALLGEAPFVFWKDMPHQDLAVGYGWFGLPTSTKFPSVQGGQVLIDVASFWRELVLAHWANQHSDYSYHCPRDKPEDIHCYGDQAVWSLVLAATGARHKDLGRALWIHPAFECRTQGRSWFVHRCQGKFLPGQAPERNDQLPLEWRCFELYEEISVPAGKDASEVFERVYKRGHWSMAPGQSPSGAKPEETLPYIRLINALLAFRGVERVIDLGCGDGTVTRQIAAGQVVGVDCVGLWPSAEVLDLDRDREQLPAGDVALLKDVLQHWPSGLILDWLAWARAAGKWRWLILTNDVHQKREGADCRLGGHRELHPHMRPLRDVEGLILLAQIAHKAVCLLECEP